MTYDRLTRIDKQINDVDGLVQRVTHLEGQDREAAGIMCDFETRLEALENARDVKLATGRNRTSQEENVALKRELAYIRTTLKRLLGEG